MKFLFLIPGTSNYFCGTCLRDQALVRALRALGHEARIACLYLPMHLEEEETTPPPLFFGGVNCYLQQKSAFFRKSPRWVDALFDAPALLRAAGRKAGMTQPDELVGMTLSMLRGEQGFQAKEVRRLAAWIRDVARPDVVVYSNAILLGSAPAVRAALPGVRIHCTLQGEDTFVEGLPAAAAREVWAAMAERGAAVDAFVAVSDYYRTKMKACLGLADERIHRVYNGLELDGYTAMPDKSGEPVIGYLSRLCRPKGVHTFVEAFRLLREDPAFAHVRAVAAGSCTAEDAELMRGLVSTLPASTAAGFSIRPNLSKPEKIRFLQSCHLLSVPVNYDEAFGLYLPEALACGTPVVQAHKGSFPELITRTGGGLTYPDDTPSGLASAWKRALADPTALRKLGRTGAESVRREFQARRMAGEVLELA